MKTTIDIPDELYRRVKAKSALAGKRVREVTIELHGRWLREPLPAGEEDAERWLADWPRTADEAAADREGTRSARELLKEARDRRLESDR